MVLKTSSRSLHCKNFSSSKTSWRPVENVLKTSWKDVLKTSWRHLAKHLEDVLKICLEDVLKICLEDVLKTGVEDAWRHVLKLSWRHILKTSWRHYGEKQNTCWRANKSKYVSNKSIFHNLYLTILRRIQNALIRTQ